MTDVRRGWATASLADICDINPRVDKSKMDHDQQVSFVPMPAVEAENGRIDVSDTRNFGAVKQGYTPFCENDVLFAKITPCMENGKMAIVPKMVSEYGFGSTEFHVLRALCGVQPRFIYHLVSNRGFRYHAEHNMTGAVGQKRVPVTLLSEHQINVPPLNEQRRIVEKIEAMFERIDEGVENLRAARSTLALYRQSLLKSAFEGRLTESWRAKNADKLEDPKVLLARIQKERDARYKAALDNWQTALTDWRDGGEEGKKPTKPRRAKDQVPLSDDQIEKLPLLPAEWTWAELGQLTWSVRDGPHYSPKYEKTGIPFISGGNIRPHGIDFETAKFISPELHKELSKRCKPELGDVLYTKGGTTGIARVNTYEIDFNVWVHVAVLKITETTVPFYLQNALNSPFCQSQAQNFTHGVGNQDLGLTRMVNIRLPICSPVEQTEITRILDARLDAADKMEAEIDAALARADALRQSILKRAFAGDLVPQDPTDEPAPALLARIKAERAAALKSKSAKAKSTKPAKRKTKA